jgi:hypothetical protein
VLHVANVAIADDDVGVAREQRPEQPGDVVAGVLIVRVGVDDVVGIELQRGVETRGKRRREAFASPETDDVLHAVSARDLDRVVGRAVVDHENLDAIDARNLARHVGQRGRQRRRLVEARDLDNELGHPTSFSTTPSHVIVRARS